MLNVGLYLSVTAGVTASFNDLNMRNSGRVKLPISAPFRSIQMKSLQIKAGWKRATKQTSAIHEPVSVHTYVLYAMQGCNNAPRILVRYQLTEILDDQ